MNPPVLAPKSAQTQPCRIDPKLGQCVIELLAATADEPLPLLERNLPARAAPASRPCAQPGHRPARLRPGRAPAPVPDSRQARRSTIASSRRCRGTRPSLIGVPSRQTRDPGRRGSGRGKARPPARRRRRPDTARCRARAELDHELDLLLVGVAVTGNRLLDLGGRVLGDRPIPDCAAASSATPRAWPTAIAVVTLREKKSCSIAIDSGRVRRDQVCQRVVQFEQAMRHRVLGGRLDRAVSRPPYSHRLHR